MPMIDVYAPADLFAAGTDRTLAEELTGALLRAEGVTAPSPLHLDNTAAYVHRLPRRRSIRRRPHLREPYASRYSRRPAP